MCATRADNAAAAEQREREMAALRERAEKAEARIEELEQHIDEQNNGIAAMGYVREKQEAELGRVNAECEGQREMKESQFSAHVAANAELRIVRTELERVQRQAAAMREALEKLSGFGPRDIDEISLHAFVNTVAVDALSEPDAGRDCFARSQVMPKRKGIYVASKVKHAQKWQALRTDGVPIVSTWIDEAGEGKSADYSELAQRCLREVAASKAVILYCEPGECLKGALVEVGAAMAYGVPVICVGECPSLSRVFCKHPLWKQVDTVDSVAHARALGLLPADLTP